MELSEPTMEAEAENFKSCSENYYNNIQKEYFHFEKNGLK
jgi:hypothetical protein